MTLPETDRRKFPRVKAPLLCRPVGGFFQKAEQPVSNVSLGGVRVYSDARHAPGERLEVELYLLGQASLCFVAEVVWAEPLATGPARWDLGLRFIRFDSADYDRLRAVLEAS